MPSSYAGQNLTAKLSARRLKRSVKRNMPTMRTLPHDMNVGGPKSWTMKAMPVHGPSIIEVMG